MVAFDFERAEGKLAYRLTNDVLFHIVMNRSERCLRGLLSAVLSIPQQEITDLKILNPIDYGSRIDAKEIILDIKAELNHTVYVNIEMQVRPLKIWRTRTLFYSARMLAEQDVGKEYDQLKAVRQIDILDFSEKDKSEYFDMYSVTNAKGDVYSDELQIYTLNLQNIDNATEQDVRRGLADWGKLFRAGTWEDIRELAEKDSVFREAGEIMGNAMTQEEDMLRRRQIAIRDYQTGMHEARGEGKVEGKAEAVCALMSNLNISFEKAAAALNISSDETEKIRQLTERNG